jgi:hypothetical protein
MGAAQPSHTGRKRLTTSVYDIWEMVLMFLNHCIILLLPVKMIIRVQCISWLFNAIESISYFVLKNIENCFIMFFASLKLVNSLTSHP